MLQLIDSFSKPWNNAIWGALIGDALGAPHEFKTGAAIPHENSVEMVMPSGYMKTFGSIPYGTWTDDGSQLLALMDTLQRHQGRYDSLHFTQNLLAWLDSAAFQAGGVVFDCGGQTQRALEARRMRKHVEFDPRHCGNGSLMRVLPVAALPDQFGISQEDAILIALEQSSVTHPQPIARLCCALYVELCWLVQAGRRDLREALLDAGEILRHRELLEPEDLAELAYVLNYGKNMPCGSGYVVSTLWTAAWSAERTSSLSQSLRSAISLGGDTDTIACVTGGLSALAYGLDATSKVWRSQMDLSAVYP